MHKRRPAASALAVAWLLLNIGLIASAAQPEDEWYVVRIAGQRAGTMHQRTERVVREGVPLFRTKAESLLTISRLGAGMELRTSSTCLETEAGDLLEVVSELQFSTVPMKSEARVEDGHVVLKSYLGDNLSSVAERTIPFSGRLLGPEGIRRASEAGLKNPGDTVIVQSFLPELSKPVTVTQVLEGVELLPESVPPREALRVTETNSAYPRKRTAWLDRSGRTLFSSDASPFGEMTTRLTTREDALSLSAPVDAAVLPFEQALARSNIRLPQARSIDAVTLRLERRNPALGSDWTDLSGPGQTVLEKTADHLILKVERSSPAPQASVEEPPAGQDPADLDEFLRSNQYLDTQDEVLLKAVQEALGRPGPEELGDALGKALRLENWVTGRMKFDAGIAFAPSREVIRNARGTCAEHAVLLAAMLRATGIPSRILTGYVYLNGVWGGHAWVEARLGGAWVGLDAAVNGPGPADAARFALVRSSLNDGLGELLSGGQGLLGNLQVTVLSYALDGRTAVVDPAAPLYAVEENLYINPGLGLRVLKPSGFVFENMDGIWPDNTLLVMEGPNGETIRILQDAWRPGRDPEESAYLRLGDLVPGGRRS
ncbi:MAG: hypothetical protein A2Y70_05130, partial [Candidatus Aminicenantes bacterium RBG_13_64_14]